MKIIDDNLTLCEECMLVLETGDVTFLDYYYDEPESTERLKTIEQGIIDLHNSNTLYKDTAIVPNYDSETGEGIDEYSIAICDCCNSRLGGKKYRYSLIGNKKGN